MGMWELPAKSLTAKGAEAAWEYNEFMKELNEAKQRRCSCMGNAAN